MEKWQFSEQRYDQRNSIYNEMLLVKLGVETGNEKSVGKTIFVVYNNVHAKITMT